MKLTIHVLLSATVLLGTSSSNAMSTSRAHELRDASVILDTGKYVFVNNLAEAALRNDMQRIAELRELRTFDAQDLENRETALHKVAQKGRLDAIRVLLAEGASVHIKDTYGVTPLHDAAFKGHKDAVELLWANGANIDNTTTAGSTPLMDAAGCGHLEVVVFLLSKGANVATRANFKTPFLEASSGGHTAIMKVLLEAGANVKDRFGSWTTPLHNAAVRGDLEATKLLLNAGADVDAQDALKNGWTALALAAKNGHKDVVELLLEAGADREHYVRQRGTAIELTKIEEIKALLAKK